MDLAMFCCLTLELIFFQIYSSRWVEAVPIPLNKDLIKANSVVSNSNSVSVTPSNLAESVTKANSTHVIPNEVVSALPVTRDNNLAESVTKANNTHVTPSVVVNALLVARDNNTSDKNAGNVLVTSEEDLTWLPAVTKDNNASITTAGTSTATVPSLEPTTSVSSQFHNIGHLLPKTGINLHDESRGVLLQHSKAVNDFTSPDFIITGDDVTTQISKGIIINSDTQKDATTVIDTNHKVRTTNGILTGLLLESTSHNPAEFYKSTELSLDTRSTESATIQLERGAVLTAFIKDDTGLTSTGLNTGLSISNGLTTSKVEFSSSSIKYSTLLGILLPSTSTTSTYTTHSTQGSSELNQNEEHLIDTDSDTDHTVQIQPDYSPPDPKLSTLYPADLWTSITKHTATKRETSDFWDLYGNKRTSQSGAINGYVTTQGQTTSSVYRYRSTTTPLNTVDTFTTQPVIVVDPQNGIPGQATPSQGFKGHLLTSSTIGVGHSAEVFQRSTTMVYIASSDATDDGSHLFDGFDGLDGRSDFKVKDIILAVCGTVGCMLTVCMLVAFTRCCCKKEKDDDDEDTGAATSGTLKALRSLKRRSKNRNSSKDNTTPSGGRESATDTTQISVECHGDSKRQSWCNDDANFFNNKEPPNSMRGQKDISVKDRIKAFECKTDLLDVKLRDDSGKPRKKKPKSKAFEEFESQGILIGFGNLPRKRSSEGASEVNTPEDDEDLFDQPMINMSQSFSNSRGSNEIDDDDFESVQRNTEILKSFRRAPPPKNRSRARRSGRRGRHRTGQSLDTRSEGGRDNGDGASMTEVNSVVSAPAYTAASQDSELDQFEASLHMPVDRSQSTRELSPARTVTIQVPLPNRTSADPSGRHSNQTNKDFYTNGIPRIQPDGASCEYDQDLSPRRYRCNSDSRRSDQARSLRPFSYHTGGEQVPNLPPRGIPKSYSQRLERTPPPMDGYSAHLQRPPPNGQYYNQLAPQEAQVHPSGVQANIPIDSLRSAMMRRWDSAHSCLPSNNSGAYAAGAYPMISQHPAGSNSEIRNTNMFEGYFPRSENLTRKFNSADSLDTLCGKSDSPTHLNGTVQSNTFTPDSPAHINGTAQAMPPLSFSRYDYRHYTTSPRWQQLTQRHSMLPALAREIEMSDDNMENRPYTAIGHPTVKFNINTAPTNV